MTGAVGNVGRFDAVFLDFDGVLVESAAIKCVAFKALYSRYGQEVASKVVSYHKEYEGISRLVKIRHCHRAFLDIRLNDAELAALGAQFSAIVEKKVIAADWVPGARDFLDAQNGVLPLFIVSGTPEEELRRIVESRCMSGYFTEVRGSPLDKDEIVRGLLDRYDLKPERTLFVGDAMTDWKAAQACGQGFLGRVLPEQADPFPPGTQTIPDLRTLGAFLI